MAKRNLQNSFYPNQKHRRFGWFSIILAITANVWIFLSISWVNRTPTGVPQEEYTIIELFKPELPTENILPQIDSTPVIVQTTFQPKPEPMKLMQPAETLARPRLVEWQPDSLTKQPGVSIDISLTEINLQEATDAVDVSSALALNQVDKPPRKISGDSPVYPVWAKARKSKGTVTLRFIVGVDGKVYNIEIYDIQGDSRFAAAARDAVEKWRFEPAINNARAIEVWCYQKIRFKSED